MLALLTCVSGISAQAADQNGGQEGQKQEERKSVLYQWTDGKGVVHITDDLNKIPEKSRSNARRLETSPGTAETPGPSGETGISPTPDKSAGDEREADLKEEWQLRMKRAKERLADAERRYFALEEKRNNLLGSWGGPASGHLAGREEADRIDQEMKQVKKEIDAARNEVENVIPEDARKAGVPPGWLRE
jgi:hypothetical protein